MVPISFTVFGDNVKKLPGEMTEQANYKRKNTEEGTQSQGNNVVTILM